MGKGVALAFARSFDGLLDRYSSACQRNEVEVGKMWLFDTGLLMGPRLIVCFPTKRHWARPSRIEWIEAGLGALVDTIQAASLSSVAVPALGCGHGGLAWTEVEPLIRQHLADLSCEIHLYPPR